MVLGLASCGYEDKQSKATARALMVYTAVQGALNDNPGTQLVNDEVYNMRSGALNISFDRTNVIDLSIYLGNDFDGYFYAMIDTYSRSVEFALWSDHEMDLNYYDYVEYTDRAYYEGTGHVIGYWA